MPELPEVEVTRRGLLAELPGRKIVDFALSGHRLRIPIPADLLHEHILGRVFLTIDRRAKYLLLRMTDGSVLIIHLGMTGTLTITPQTKPQHPHDHLALLLDDDRELRFNDARRLGALMVWPACAVAHTELEFSAREGIEPLTSTFNADHLQNLAKRRTLPIKSLLMNGRLIAGIGNIYANEILFAAQIHPLTQAFLVHRQGWSRIVFETQRILLESIEIGGATIADFLGADGHPGYFQLHFKVYNQEGLACTTCASPIVKITVAGRATYFCPTCQPTP